MKPKKQILFFSITILLIGVVLAFVFDEYYRIFIRSGFKIVNGSKIEFVGKNFHLFSSRLFAITFGVFLVICFLLIQSAGRKILLTVLVVLFFLVINFIISLVESNSWIKEYTTCIDGIKRIDYNELRYDRYLLISTMLTILFLLIMRKMVKD